MEGNMNTSLFHVSSVTDGCVFISPSFIVVSETKEEGGARHSRPTGIRKSSQVSYRTIRNFTEYKHAIHTTASLEFGLALSHTHPM